MLLFLDSSAIVMHLSVHLLHFMAKIKWKRNYNCLVWLFKWLFKCLLFNCILCEPHSEDFLKLTTVNYINSLRSRKRVYWLQPHKNGKKPEVSCLVELYWNIIYNRDKNPFDRCDIYLSNYCKIKVRRFVGVTISPVRLNCKHIKIHKLL